MGTVSIAMDINKMPRPDECVELVVTAGRSRDDDDFEFTCNDRCVALAQSKRIRMCFRLPHHTEGPDHDGQACRAAFALARQKGLLQSALHLDFDKYHRVCATIDHIVFDSF